jgi:hypothetical protein
MEDVVNRLARELANAIAAALADDPKVEACRQKARAAGFEMRVTLEALVGFVNRNDSEAVSTVAAPADLAESAQPGFEITGNDRRFLKSLRIAADEAKEEANRRPASE